MLDNLILDFPVLKKEGMDFSEEVSYEAEGRKKDGKLTITHTLKGRSFIRQLIQDGDATFSVLLHYRDSAERQNYQCSPEDISTDDSKIVATQIIPMDFSYAPEIMSSIVILEDKDVAVGASSGLTDFWEHRVYKIPQYARIALAPKLTFSQGTVSNLIELKLDKTLGSGEMWVEVYEQEGEGKKPVSLWCEKGVYDELSTLSEGTREAPRDAAESMRLAIITQALCAVYAYVKDLGKDDVKSNVTNVVLKAHLDLLREKGQDWESDYFDPSLAATKMQPYFTQILSNEAS